jgi:hypothetical protein
MTVSDFPLDFFVSLRSDWHSVISVICLKKMYLTEKVNVENEIDIESQGKRKYQTAS